MTRCAAVTDRGFRCWHSAHTGDLCGLHVCVEERHAYNARACLVDPTPLTRCGHLDHRCNDGLGGCPCR